MNSDFKELLQAFNEHKVEYLIVGAYAVMHYTQPRYTKDLDIWIRPDSGNSFRVEKAFQQFGLGFFGGLSREDFAQPGTLFAIGVEPVRIDFLTSVPPLDFQECWPNRATFTGKDGLTIHYLPKEALISAKTNAGRPQDLADLDELRRAAENEEPPQ